jgi:ABC-type multidrug transport system ATPase subunit
MKLIIDSFKKQFDTGIYGLSHFTLSLQPGILGFIGPNGAGKSKQLRIISASSSDQNARLIPSRLEVACHHLIADKAKGRIP